MLHVHTNKEVMGGVLIIRVYVYVCAYTHAYISSWPQISVYDNYAYMQNTNLCTV